MERRWRYLVLYVPFFFVGVVFFVFLIPESIEWLLMTGQIKRACNQLQSILDSRHLEVDVYEELFSSIAASQMELEANHVQGPDSRHVGSLVNLSLNQSETSYDDIEENLRKRQRDHNGDEDNDDDDDDDDQGPKKREEVERKVEKAEHARDDNANSEEIADDRLERELLLKMASSTNPTHSLRRRWSFTTIVVVVAVAALTFINYFVYYGLVLATDEFTGDRYLNFFYFALADLGGVAIAMTLINVIPRRLIMCGAYGVIIAVTGFVFIYNFTDWKEERRESYDHLVLGCTLVIKIEILAAVSVMELSSVEMPPTSIRSFSSGIFFACKGMAGVTASFVSFLLRVDSYAEAVFFVLALLATALLFALPEMKNAAIPKTRTT